MTLELEMGLAAFASIKPANRWSRARLDGLGRVGRKPRFATSHEGARSMSGGFSLKATLLALLSLPISNAAIAGVAENMGGVAEMLKRAAPVTKAQYDSSDDGGLCWYDQGWRGPGWYLCGDEWDYGVGWFGLHRNRHRHLHGIAIAHPVRERHRAVRVAGRPGVRIGGVHSNHHPRAGFAWTRSPSRDVSVAHHFGGAAAVYHSYGVARPVYHTYGGAGRVYQGYGGAGPALHGGASAVVPSFGGGPAAHSFAAPAGASVNFGGGGSHGFGGASFPSAGHGMGH
jgi:hypothetical protein